MTTALAAAMLLLAAPQPASAQQPTVHELARSAQARVVKVYGAGGLSGLEAYQSGFLVSPIGHVATAWSYVLDVPPVVVLDDGRRFEATIIDFQPALELAVLKIDASDLPYFDVPKTTDVAIGDPVLAVSNLFGIAAGNEPASVMQGMVAAVTTLDARGGTLKTPYQGSVLVLDLIANNPGAAGGALVGVDGELTGMLGKELRDSETGVWLNYAIPASVLRGPIGDIIAGRQTTVPDAARPLLDRERAHDFETLGIVLVPDVLEATPAFVDAVRPASAAARVGLQPDDLILLVDGKRVQGQAVLRQMLRQIDRRDAVPITIQRGNQILPLILQP